MAEKELGEGVRKPEFTWRQRLSTEILAYSFAFLILLAVLVAYASAWYSIDILQLTIGSIAGLLAVMFEYVYLRWKVKSARVIGQGIVLSKTRMSWAALFLIIACASSAVLFLMELMDMLSLLIGMLLSVCILLPVIMISLESRFGKIYRAQ